MYKGEYMLEQTTKTDLATIISQRDFAVIRARLADASPPEIADALTDLDVADQVVAFRVLPRDLAADVFEYLPIEEQEQLIRALAREDITAILNDMAPDDRTRLLDELPAAVTKLLLALLTPAERLIATRLLGYPEQSVGRLVTPEYVRVRPEWTIAYALDHIRRYGHDSETLDDVYVIDDHGVLIDDIPIRWVLLAAPTDRVADVMDGRFVALPATADQEQAVAVFRREDRTVLPVTDTAGVLIGIVTVDDMLDVVEAEATEDIQKIGGSEALDEPYMDIAFGRLVRKRAGWLVVLFIGEMLTATAMGYFENEIARAVVLALFVPLIISSGGNSGSQAATLVIRAMALGEVRLRDWWQVMRRELLSGLALGGILGSIGFVRIAVWATLFNSYGEYWYLIGLTVALALLGIVLWGTLAGSMLPLLLQRLGLDPATSSAPFVATLVDVTGLIIYFGVARVLLSGTLL